MTKLEKLIAESKVREAGMTNGPWECQPSRYAHENQVYVQFYPDTNQTFVVPSYKMNINGEFIASARTELPLFRNMLEVAVEWLHEIMKVGTGPDGNSVEANAAYRALAEINRLAAEAGEGK